MESNPQSFNRYAYGNNNPLKFVDPDGEFAIVLAIPWLAATLKTTLFLGSATAVGYGGAQVIKAYNESSDSPENSPEVPEVLVGDQSDKRAGQRGKNHTSGQLLPEYGGTGDYETDLGVLAGQTRPAVQGDPAPIGASIGENGIFGRPNNSSSGSSIDIPARGNKPKETLHYD